MKYSKFISALLIVVICYFSLVVLLNVFKLEILLDAIMTNLSDCEKWLAYGL